MKPIDFLEIKGRKIGLYVDLNNTLFDESALLVPLEAFVDIISVEIAKKVARVHSLVFTEMSLSSEDFSLKTKAFAVFLKGKSADYYKENRKARGKEEEYEKAKSDLQHATAQLFEAIENLVKKSLDG